MASSGAKEVGDSTQANLEGHLLSVTLIPNASTVIAMVTLQGTVDQDVDLGLDHTNATEGGIPGQDPPIQGVIGDVTIEMKGGGHQGATVIAEAVMTAEIASIATVDGTLAQGHRIEGETFVGVTVLTSGERMKRGLEAGALRRIEEESMIQEGILLLKALVITVSNLAN